MPCWSVITGQCLSEGLAASNAKQYSFLPKLILQEPASRSKLRGRRSAAGLHASVILFIALPEAKDNADPG
jgi:hypothetical protein